MQKLVRGIVDYRERVRPSMKDTFARLALGQRPDCLMIACSDSRVVPNLFASTDPGDLFVVRNVGNLVPPVQHKDHDASVSAAIEFAVEGLGVGDIVVCGHSECGAMMTLLDPSRAERMPQVRRWLAEAGVGMDGPALDPTLAPHNRVSQLSVLRQLEHLKTWPAVAERVAAGTLGLHAWWFDIADADVLRYDATAERFVALE